LIIDIWDIDLILKINNNIIEILNDEEISCNLLDFWIIERYMNFNLDLEVIMNEIDISENQETQCDTLDLRDIFKCRIDLIIIINKINNNIIREI